jgi:hypothetical protein
VIKKQFLRQGLDILQQSFSKAIRLIVVDLGFQVLNDLGKAMHLNEAQATLFDNIELVQEQLAQILKDLCFAFELFIGDRESWIFVFLVFLIHAFILDKMIMYKAFEHLIWLLFGYNCLINFFFILVVIFFLGLPF